ncbi:MAG TPA: prepilin-type N-terminal cleavage/methylation domain-containing protein [Rubrivivax sp.]|nr:prepilin-type N-terminal cleavage/methylation domain-containing protein [Rubrivivax sp.]
MSGAACRSAAWGHVGRKAQRGVSLVEAIVAMAVMAFGMMAIVGLQTTLRANSDVAKQRSEAVRIAEEAIEAARAFSLMAGYNNIGDLVVDPVPLDQATTNAVYKLTRTVVDTMPGMKSIQVEVTWVDRTGQPQSVMLNSVIAGIEPALSGILSLQPASVPVRQPLGRNPSVPALAIPLGGDKSAYRPPGAPDTVVWVFDNLTGVITSVCTFPGTDVSQLVPADNCFEEPSYLISGFVRFSLGPSPDAETPTGEQIPLGMYAVAIGVEFADGECFPAPVQADPPLTYTSYVCRVPQSADATWTGSILLGPPLDLALYDVCRYSNGQPGNINHPRVYTGLDRSLTEQNMLVVDQDVACPSGTRRLQPPSLLPPPPPPA